MGGKVIHHFKYITVNIKILSLTNDKMMVSQIIYCSMERVRNFDFYDIERCKKITVYILLILIEIFIASSCITLTNTVHTKMCDVYMDTLKQITTYS